MAAVGVDCSVQEKVWLLGHMQRHGVCGCVKLRPSTGRLCYPSPFTTSVLAQDRTNFENCCLHESLRTDQRVIGEIGLNVKNLNVFLKISQNLVGQNKNRPDQAK